MKLFFSRSRRREGAPTRGPRGTSGGTSLLRRHYALSDRSTDRKEDGFVATVLCLGLLVIMLMLATAGGMALIHLRDEVKVLERQQIKRLHVSETNSVPIVQLDATKTDLK